MDENTEIDLKSLRKIAMSCAYIVAIDSVFEKAEWEVLTTFLRKYWKDEFGNRKEFFETVIDRLKSTLKRGEHGRREIETYVESLAEQLNWEQKKIVIKLMENIVRSDFDIDKAEVHFLFFVKEKFIIGENAA